MLPLRNTENSSHELSGHARSSGLKMIKKDEKFHKIKDKELAKSKVKLRKLKKKRIIVRNLSFEVSEEELKNIFSEYGKVLEVTIPVKEDGKKKGFAFVQFDDTRSVINSMKALNYKPIKGRPIAIDYAVNKSEYLEKRQSQSFESEKNSMTETSTECKTEIKSEPESSDSDNDQNQNDLKSDSDVSDDEKRANRFLKEFGLKEELNNDLSDESSDENEEVGSSDEEEEDKITGSQNSQNDDSSEEPKKSLKKISHDVSEGKTIFIRNLSFNTEEEDLQELMEQYGECTYCLICIDKLTEHPKGTAFVKFKETSSSQKLIDEAAKDPGIFLDGRRLSCDYALSKENISEKSNKLKKPKDKRNLNLLKCSVIIPGSPEAEGVSQADMTKRRQLEIMKKSKLRNTNFFVSDKRLVIHNLPENFSEAELRKLFKTASGKEAAITEARIMRDFKKINAEGVPHSRGFGFVCFTCHEDALKALLHLNNNPNLFTSFKRPIVEFSVENIEAVLSKERKKEKNRMRNKRRTDEKNERKVKSTDDDLLDSNLNSTSECSPAKKKKRKRGNTVENRKKKIAKTDLSCQLNEQEIKSNLQKKKKQKIDLSCQSNEQESKSNLQKKKKQKNKKKSNKKNRQMSMNKEDKKQLSLLADKYKTKLLNKLS